jgi:hypothetical protein
MILCSLTALQGLIQELRDLYGDFCSIIVCCVSCLFVLNVNHALLEQVFVFYFCPALNLLFENFLYVVLLHGTVDTGYFLQNFQWHIFRDIYFTEM